jgi:hypothetical protein
MASLPDPVFRSFSRLAAPVTPAEQGYYQPFTGLSGKETDFTGHLFQP